MQLGWRTMDGPERKDLEESLSARAMEHDSRYRKIFGARFALSLEHHSRSVTTAGRGGRTRSAVRSGCGFGFRQAGGRTDRGALRAATCAADGLTVVWRSAGVDPAGTTRSARQRRNRARDSGVYKLCERGCWPSSLPRSCWPRAEPRWRRGRLAPLRREHGPRRGRVSRVRQLSRRACRRAARPPRGGDAVPRRPGSRPAF